MPPVGDDEMEIAMKKNLIKIKMSPVTVYPNVAYPLMIILNEPHLKEWYYEHFINIYAQCWDNTLFRIDFLDSSRYFGDVLECCSLTIEDAKNVEIVDYIIDSIDRGFCLNVFAVDEYYLSNSNVYNKEHFIHETLIYGYDQEQKVINVVGYDQNDTFSKFTYKMEEFVEAFNAAINNAPYYLVDALHLLKIRHFFCDYVFSYDNFVNELEKYVYSIPDYKKKYFSLASEDVTTYGNSVYDEMIECLDKKINNITNNNVLYLCFHFMYEHKAMLLERLKYIQQKYVFDEKYDTRVEKYEKIVANSNLLRLNFLKKAWRESNFENRMEVNDIDYLKKIKNEVFNIQEEEKDLLIEICNVLKNNKR